MLKSPASYLQEEGRAQRLLKLFTLYIREVIYVDVCLICLLKEFEWTHRCTYLSLWAWFSRDAW